MQRHLIIFAKEPRMGRVKSRLARDVGRITAWRFYRLQLASLTRRLAADPRWRTYLFVAPDTAVHEKNIWPKGAALRAQGQGNLGERMQRALEAVGPGPRLLIGSDIPGITPGGIAHAFKLLGNADAVFGPAEDGGYWLVGFKGTRRLRAFENVRWSTQHALADTLANLPAGAKHARAETLADVDDGAAFERFAATRHR